MRWANCAIFLLFNLSLTGMFSCKNKPEKIQSYQSFELVELIDRQVGLLSKEGKSLRKTIDLNGKLEEIQVSPDSSSWVKELSIYKSADINKPGLRPFYNYTRKEINKSLEELYQLNDSGRCETTWLRIIKDINTKKITRISARQNVVNPIYVSMRYMDLFFSEFDESEILLDSFAISGYQKMMSQDTVLYSTSGKVMN